ncbi:hypothetical protein D3C86_1805010 [compost metagenome]
MLDTCAWAAQLNPSAASMMSRMIFIKTAPELLKLFMGVAVGRKKDEPACRTHVCRVRFTKNRHGFALRVNPGSTRWMGSYRFYECDGTIVETGVNRWSTRYATRATRSESNVGCDVSVQPSKDVIQATALASAQLISAGQPNAQDCFSASMS